MILIPFANAQTLLPGNAEDVTYGGLVAKLTTGNLSLSDVPLFIAYFIQFLIVIAGIVAFLMILIGGYQYIIGGVYSEMKEKGKKTLTSAITGFILALLAYGIVNLVQLAVTS